MTAFLHGSTHPAPRPAARFRALFALVLCHVIITPGTAMGAPEVWAFWAEHDPSNQYAVDHEPWQKFLNEYVTTAGDGINLVAYARARNGPGRQLVRNYLDRLTAIDPRRLDRDAQLAYWINLYNALTVEVVLRHPGKKSIRRMGDGFFSTGPWDDELVVIAAQGVTLNDIEHRILRPIWRDHRIHFAVNCASLGCPNLSRTAFEPHNLETLLSSAERTYINHPRAVYFNARESLRLSSLFTWYREDFAPTEAALLDYLASHHSDRQAALAGYRGDIAYDYDWRLNAEG